MYSSLSRISVHNLLAAEGSFIISAEIRMCWIQVSCLPLFPHPHPPPPLRMRIHWPNPTELQIQFDIMKLYIVPNYFKCE